MDTVRVILYQKSLGIPVTDEDVRLMAGYAPHFICFPEYFFVDQALGTRAQTPQNQALQLDRIREISLRTGAVVIGGTMPELAGDKLYNTCFVFDGERLLGSYRKKNLYLPEVGHMTPGERFMVLEARGVRFGVLICADIFDEAAFYFMRDAGARLVFAPTFSPRKTETAEEKFRRDNELYVRAARVAGAVFVKVCGVKSAFRPSLQARSLIVSPEGVLYRTLPGEEDTEMIIMREVPLA